MPYLNLFVLLWQKSNDCESTSLLKFSGHNNLMTHPCKYGSFCCSFMLCSKEPASWSAAVGLYPALFGVHSDSRPSIEGMGDNRPQEDVFDDALGRKSGLNWKPALYKRNRQFYLRIKAWCSCVARSFVKEFVYFVGSSGGVNEVIWKSDDMWIDSLKSRVRRWLDDDDDDIVWRSRKTWRMFLDFQQFHLR